MVILDQQNTTSTGAVGIKTSADNHALAQSFTCGYTAKFNSFIAKLYKSGTPSGNVTATLYADDGTSPSGSVLSTSDSTDVSTLTTDANGAEVTFTFPDDYIVLSGTKYWVVLEVTYAQSGSDYINWRQNGDAYASGNCNRRNSGGTWLDDQGAIDNYFKSYVNTINRSQVIIV